MEDYKLKATNPQQYDSPELDWTIGGDINSYSRIFFRNNLRQHLEDLSGKSVLDIGSGVGHLFPMLQELKASSIEGIEPSRRNVEYSRNLYPNITIHESTLQNFISDKKFDVVICIMAFEHVLDINNAFSCIANVIKPGGSLYLIFGDKEFHVFNNPPETEVDVQEIGEGIVATKTVRHKDGIDSTMYDIFRPVQLFIDSAKESGFGLLNHVELKAELKRRPSCFANKPICHLLVFKHH
jgi:SAM-dependent methyltransferase